MKKFASVALGLLLCLGLLTGCGEDYTSTESTIFVCKNGSVVSNDVEEFDESLFSIEDLEAYVTAEIAAYNEEYGKDLVELDSITVTEGVASLIIKYDTVEDFNRFTGYNLYVGSLAEGLAEGYDFNVPFAVISEGGSAEQATAGSFIGSSDYQVAVIDAPYNIHVYGTVAYVSASNVAYVDENTIAFGIGNKMFDIDDPDAVEEDTTTTYETEAETEEPVEDTDSASNGSVSEDEWDFSEEAQEETKEFVFEETAETVIVTPKLGSVIIVFSK